MRTLGEVLRLSKNYLDEHRVVQSRKMAEEIIANVLKMSRMELYLYFDRSIEESQWRYCQQLLKRKSDGEPLEYIFKDIHFYSCRLTVTPSVLIPRQETEILLHKALKEIPKEAKVAWDICSGSGCLGLGLKKTFPHLEVTLSDISPECLEVAKINARRNQLDVQVLLGDLLAPFEGKKADVILCNPPYVSQSEYGSLEDNVKLFEPYIALVAGETGLEFYERLSSELPNHLHSGGRVYFEIGTGQGGELLEIFHQSHWKSRRYEKDWAGHDRFFFLELE